MTHMHETQATNTRRLLIWVLLGGLVVKLMAGVFYDMGYRDGYRDGAVHSYNEQQRLVHDVVNDTN